MVAVRKIRNKTTHDPVSDCLTRIKNALRAGKSEVSIPFSKLKLSLLQLLKTEGYLSSVVVINEDDVTTKQITVEFSFYKSRAVINGMRRISKPGFRQYTKSKYAPKVLNGLGISILSTNLGLVTDRVAKTKGVGGELICQVW